MALTNSRTRSSLVLVVLLGATIHAQEWTRFRGPNGSGIGSAPKVPSTWTTNDFKWKLALPGAGHSSPAIWGDHLFVTVADESKKQFSVIGVSASEGRILWQHGSAFSAFRKHNYNSFASGSPAVDEERVYVCWSVPARCSLLALKHDGTVVWERDLGPFASQHGGGSSPVVYGDTIVFSDQQDGESFVLAVDRKTGQPRWKTPRKTTEAAYGTPCLYTPKGRSPALIFSTESHGISALEPSTGKVLWEYAQAYDKRTVSSPMIAGDLIIGSCGSGGGGNYVVAIHPGEPETGKAPSLAYTIRKSAPYVPTSICVGELLFLWSDGGILSCVKAATGEVQWQERVGGDFFSSPVCIDDRLFNVSTRGEVVVVPATGKFEILARTPLGETTHSSPAVSGGRLYIHTLNHLVCIGGSSEGVKP